MDAGSGVRFCVVGLGNPGERYASTRHNVGFLLADFLAESFRTDWFFERKWESLTARPEGLSGSTLLLKPQTFMNASGRAVARVASFFKLPASAFLVLHDDITLPVGRVKVSAKGGAGGHNGVSDIFQRLGEGIFRFRIGIGSKANPSMDLKDHVLGRLTPDEKASIDAALPEWREAILYFLTEGPEKAMNRINRSSNPKV